MSMDNLLIETKNFIQDMKNPNTLRMTNCHVKTFKDYIRCNYDEHRDLIELSGKEMDTYLAGFYLKAKKADGKEYEPGTITNIMCSLNRYLKEMKYPYNIYSSQEFSHSRDVLYCKRKFLKQQGLGNFSHRSEVLSSDEIELLYEKNLLGASNPTALVNTIWLNFTCHFGLRGRQEHTNMLLGDVEIKVTSEGQEYLEFTERETKTRKGQPLDLRTHQPKIFSISSSDRCPVKLFKEFLSRRPQSELSSTSRMYLGVLPPSKFQNQQTWFKTQPMGKNTKYN